MRLHRNLALTAICITPLVLAGCSAGDTSDSAPASAPSSPQGVAPEEALRQLTQKVPSLRVHWDGNRVSRLYGAPMAEGATAAASVRNFVRSYASVLGTAPDELSVADEAGVPLKIDLATGEPEYVAFRIQQTRGGYRVLGSEAVFVVRNEETHPLLLVASGTRILEDFVPERRGSAEDVLAGLDWETIVENAVGYSFPEADEPELVVWPGTEGTPEKPRLAVSFVVDNGPLSAPRQRWRITLDAVDGSPLQTEDLVVFAEFSGGVHGHATVGGTSAVCGEEALAPLPHSFVGLPGGVEVMTAPDGAYSVEWTGTEPATLTSALTGKWFRVRDVNSTRDEILEQEATAPAEVDFIHGQEADEYTQAQVNAYVYANQVRDWVLDHHPDYPVVGTQQSFPVWVNREGGDCPGNAWYDGSSINFCAAGTFDPGDGTFFKFANSTIAGIVHHEYGHHLVAVSGSGQGEFGEGFSDAVAALYADEPGMAYGFYHDDAGAPMCDTPSRTANNDCKYLATGCSDCGAEIHDCGQLLSGAVWSVREQLADTEPDTFRQLMAQYLLGSALMHVGRGIDPSIAIDWLTLDDDDGNLDNGTPHRQEICAGFEQHDLPCPPLAVGLTVSPQGQTFASQGPIGGPFDPATRTFTVENLGPDPIDFEVTTEASWVTLDVTSGSLAVGDQAEVTIGLSADAETLTEGVHLGSVSFVNLTDGIGDTTRDIKLVVGEERLQYRWTMATDPGWTMEGSWQWGSPEGLGSYYLDPESGYTGANVLGYNLSGDYEANLGQTHVTTGAIDLSGVGMTTLRFKRWLNVEGFDQAQIGISTDGETWTTVWDNPQRRVLDQGWTDQTVDLSEWADGEANVRLRWTMSSDDIIQYSGWNLDDIEIWGLGTTQSCEDEATCDDGDFCNGQEQCFGGGCQLGTPWPDECVAATTLEPFESSGAFGTTGEIWFVAKGIISGWQVNAVSGRTIRVNGVEVAPGGALPEAYDGKYYFQFTAGDSAQTSWSFW